MAPYLILDTYLEPAGAASHITALAGPRATVSLRPPLGDALPPRAEGWSGLLLTGSAASATDASLAWLAPLRALVRDALDHDVPVFGICFGHQVLAQAALGPAAVRRAARPEIGWEEIEVLGDHPLLAELAPRFPCFVSHDDEVAAPAGSLQILARSAACPVQAFQVPGRRAFGIQFHPEMPLPECERLVRKHLPRIDPEADLDAVLARSVDGRPLGIRILESFFRLAGDPRQP